MRDCPGRDSVKIKFKAKILILIYRLKDSILTYNFYVYSKKTWTIKNSHFQDPVSQ